VGPDVGDGVGLLLVGPAVGPLVGLGVFLIVGLLVEGGVSIVG
jgi:hypothetical protein